jgi:hypothetical protein
VRKWWKTLAMGSAFALTAGACHLITGHDELEEKGAAKEQPCTLDNECQSKFCEDGVCCSSSCLSSCSACDIEGSIGSCSPRPPGPDPTGVCEGVCGGQGACVLGDLLGVGTIGDGTAQFVRSLAVDSFDRVIVGGTYSGALDMDAASPPPTASETAFVGRYSVNGALPTTLHHSLGSLAGIEVQSLSVAAGANDELLVVGTSATGDRDLWLHAPGSWAGPVTLGGDGNQDGVAIASLPSGEIVVVARYGLGGTTFGGATYGGVLGGAMLAVLDENGAVLATRGLGDDVEVGGGGLAADDDVIYLTGRHAQALESEGEVLLPAPLTFATDDREGGSDNPAPLAASRGVFVLRLNAALEVQWARALGGQSVPMLAQIGEERLVVVRNVDSGESDYAQMNALSTVDGAPLWAEKLSAEVTAVGGNAEGPVIGGRIFAAVDFAGGELAPFDNTPTAFVAAFDDNGGQRWARALVSGHSQAVRVDAQGNVLVAGDFEGVFDLDVGDASSTTDDDGFVAKLRGDGQPLWQRTLGSSEPQSVSALVGFKGDVLVAGSFDEAISVGDGQSKSFSGDRDAFVARFLPQLDARWLLPIEGVGEQRINGMVATDSGTIIVAACASDNGPGGAKNGSVRVGDELLADNTNGTVLFDIDQNGTLLGHVHDLSGDVPLECDAPLGMAEKDGQIYLAGHVPQLEFDRTGYLQRLDGKTLDVLTEVEFELNGIGRVDSLAVTLKTVVVAGSGQDAEGGNQAYLRSFANLTLDFVADDQFTAERVLVRTIGDQRIAAIIASSAEFRLDGKVGKPVGGHTNGFLAIMDTPQLELVALYALGPMNPTALEVDAAGNLVLAGTLPVPVDWGGAVLTPDGVDSFVIKLSQTGERLVVHHVGGTGTETITALAKGSLDVTFVGGSFDGSVVIDNEPRFGSGIDGLLMSIGP